MATTALGAAGLERFDIYIRHIAAGREPASARLSRAFGLDVRRAYEVVQSLPRVVKRNVPAEQLERYARTLRELGAEYEFRPAKIAPQQVIAVGAATDDADAARNAHGSTLTLTLPPAPEQERPAATAAQPPPAAPTREVIVDPRPLAVQSAPEPPPAVATPQASAWSETPLAGAWGPVATAPAAGAQASETTTSSQLIELSPAWQMPGFDSRSQWVVDGARVFDLDPDGRPQPTVGGQAPGSADPLAAVPDPGALVLETESPGERRGRAFHGGRPREPMESAPPAAVGTPLRGGARMVGHVYGQTVAQHELPTGLRWLLRVGLGVSLFVLLTVVRHSRFVDDEVEGALANWGQPGSVRATAQRGGPASGPGSAEPAGAHGPIALDWLQDDMHQLTSGDKDRVRGLVQRFKEAGAPEVYVGAISNMGIMQMTGELIVAMPSDPTLRTAVHAVHESFLRATFGALAPQSRTSGEVLHVTL